MLGDLVDAAKLVLDPNFRYNPEFLLKQNIFPCRSFQVGNSAKFFQNVKRGNLEAVE